LEGQRRFPVGTDDGESSCLLVSIAINGEKKIKYLGLLPWLKSTKHIFLCLMQAINRTKSIKPIGGKQPWLENVTLINQQ
jgi:hypothetical protein